jgi:flagellin
MSLGVLNNITAIYAENNLNSTQASLQTTLQQLSSGSRINSGADDAAGLSLADGLGANSAALNQSAINAQQGVGLLQVADGALSQVNSLLTRGITLATEASNGTLNTTQDAAANQEYQSILAEINNIGSTTSYNSQQVFTGAAGGTEIFTGDSSSTGSSADDLYFAPLTSATVGDAGGTVTLSTSGQFLDLTSDTAGVVTTAATQTDAISGALTFTITLADTNTEAVTTTAATVSGLISEINKDGIEGVTASFTTAGAAGLTSAGVTAAGDTGILVTNTNPNVVIDDTTAAVTDTPTGEASTAAASTRALATIAYQPLAAGDTTANLSVTDLSTSGDAAAALLALNGAIGDVAAQRGYLGAQINTLDAVSNVQTTQSTNIVSAQNGVLATDYGAASSNLSKYEILSQTGISALAQANSVQQEVLKLLQ